ncbi:triose-phosphate isomerase [Cryomorphaceae bacterium]|nr:triose-phosphate isomerase [Cryomorphaceae bacterium]
MGSKMVAGNWKMNHDFPTGIDTVTEVVKQLEGMETPDVAVVIAPSYLHLEAIQQMTEDFPSLHVSAQDCSSHESGAFTGEVSANMIASIGAQYVILGHSERRAYHGEDGELLLKKLEQAFAAGLRPIYCVGEQLQERYDGKQEAVVQSQLEEVLGDLTEEQMNRVVIAYEPVWAIGTGETATAEQAQEMHAFIRQWLRGRFGDDIAESVSVLYGGSCKPSNAEELFSQPDVDGGLIGGASLKADDFVKLVEIRDRV